mgnify:CR=1 FL=1
MELAGLLAEYESTLDYGLDCLSQAELVDLGVAINRLVDRVDAKQAVVFAAMKKREAHCGVR